MVYLGVFVAHLQEVMATSEGMSHCGHAKIDLLCTVIAAVGAACQDHTGMHFDEYVLRHCGATQRRSMRAVAHISATAFASLI